MLSPCKSDFYNECNNVESYTRPQMWVDFVKPKNRLSGKMHTENHRCRTCRVAEVMASLLFHLYFYMIFQFFFNLR